MCGVTDHDLADTTTIELERRDDTVHHAAIATIDDALGRMMQRDLVSSTEVADLLLDLRTLLTNA